MPKKAASDELRKYFASELQVNANATLEEAAIHLRDLAEHGPDDELVNTMNGMLVETEALIRTYQEHTPLTDFV